MPANGKGHKHTSYVTVMMSRLKVQTAEMRECDLEETTQRGHGNGGQAQNKIATAVRLRHKPTGLEVFINGRDQLANRKTARAALAGKLDQWLHSQETRETYAGAGRGSKVRTYNLQDSRITDHRTGAKCHRPELVLKDGRFELLR